MSTALNRENRLESICVRLTMQNFLPCWIKGCRRDLRNTILTLEENKNLLQSTHMEATLIRAARIAALVFISLIADQGYTAQHSSIKNNINITSV
tara:strand:+ start:1722 stop:2006 length:285 start_codon:yes stop_codon:yes gene_type:complete